MGHRFHYCHQACQPSGRGKVLLRRQLAKRRQVWSCSDFHFKIAGELKIDHRGGDVRLGDHDLMSSGLRELGSDIRTRCSGILELKVKSSILVLWIWRKLLIGCQEK